MKKLLLLFCALLCLGGSEVWATIDIKYVASEVKISAQGGINPATYYKTDGTTGTETDWYAKNVTNSAIPITLDFGAVTGISNYSGGINVYGTKTLTISLPSDYKISSYTISGTPTGNCSLTPAGGSANAWTKGTLSTLTVNSVNNYTTTIAFSGEADGNSECIIADLKIVFTVANGDAVTPVIDNGLYTVTYAKNGSATSYMTSDFRFVNKWNRTSDALASVASAGLMFTRVSGTNDTYYIQSPKDDSYLYANGVGSVGASSPYQYRNILAITSKPLNATKDSKFKWKLVQTGEKYYIRPFDNTNTAIAVYSDKDYYFSYYDNGSYDYAKAQLTSTTIAATINAYNNEINPLIAGEGVGYPNPEASTSTTFLATYRDVYLNNNKTEDSFKQLYKDFLAYLKETNIVMPTDGKVYTFTNVQYDGTTKYLNSSGGTMSVGSSEGSATKYICHKINASQFAFISVDDWYWMIAAHKNSGGTTVLQTYDENAPLTISQFYSNNSAYTPLATPESTFGLVQIIGVRKGDSSKKSVAIISIGGAFDVSSGAYFNTSYSSAYQIKEVADYYNKVTLTSDGTDAYASLFLPISVTIPEGITAYAVASQNGDYAHMESIVSNGTLPKNTATILKKPGQDENEIIHLSPATAAGSEYEETNLLDGTVETITRASLLEDLGSGSIYVLAKGDEGLGLYNYTGTNIAKGKAYLYVADTSIKALTFDFGDATGINTVHGSEFMDNGSPIYNLAGQRMSKLQKGVNIVNGKKIMVK